MLNLLKGYICRSLPEVGDLTTNPNLQKKVDKNGGFLPFRGNTVVFLLEDPAKERLCSLREHLYEAAPDMLAERLETSTFHMTLHDLVNGPGGTPELDAGMARAQTEARAVLGQWSEMAPLRMRGTWIFNMVNTSLVLGLEPEDGESEQSLGQMYQQLESVIPLGYALTPHITLAYFRPGTYGPEQLSRLRAVLKPIKLTVELKAENLVLQNFEDMNHYTTVR